MTSPISNRTPQEEANAILSVKKEYDALKEKGVNIKDIIICQKKSGEFSLETKKVKFGVDWASIGRFFKKLGGNNYDFKVNLDNMQKYIDDVSEHKSEIKLPESENLDTAIDQVQSIFNYVANKKGMDTLQDRVTSAFSAALSTAPTRRSSEHAGSDDGPPPVPPSRNEVYLDDAPPPPERDPPEPPPRDLPVPPPRSDVRSEVKSIKNVEVPDDYFPLKSGKLRKGVDEKIKGLSEEKRAALLLDGTGLDAIVKEVAKGLKPESAKEDEWNKFVDKSLNGEKLAPDQMPRNAQSLKSFRDKVLHALQNPQKEARRIPPASGGGSVAEELQQRFKGRKET